MNNRSNKSKFIKIGALCAMISLIFSEISFLILGILKSNYDPIHSTVSELGESGGMNSEIASGVFLINGLLIIIFAYGLNLELKNEKKIYISSILILLSALFDSVGSAIFPCDPGGVIETFTGTMHAVVTVIGFLCLIFVPLIFVKEVKEKDEWKNLLTISKIFGILGIFASILFIGSAVVDLMDYHESFIGITQRIAYLIYQIWFALIAVNLYRTD